MKIFKVVLMFVLVFSMLAGCNTKEEPQVEKIVTVAKDVEIASLDPHIATDGLSFEVIGTFLEGLYTYDADGNVIPSIATGHEVSSDGKVFTFTLRDAKWSNGTAVTAHDFVFSWRRLVDPNTASEYSFIAQEAGIKNAGQVIAGELPTTDLGVKAIDDKTLEVTLESSVPYFLQLMTFVSFFPLNEEFVVAQGEGFAQTPEAVLANGPFKVTEWERGYGLKTAKNEEYWDKDVVKIDGVDFRIFKDYQTAALEFESGNINISKLTAELVDRYNSDPAFTKIPAGYVWYVAPNYDKAEFQNENFRLALAHAFNKDHIATTILNDGSNAADYIVPRGLSTGPDGRDFRDSAGTYLVHDVAKAQDYWAKAKEELGVETVELELLFDDAEDIKKMAEYLQAQFETNLEGLTVTLKPQPKKNRLQLMREHNYDFGLTRWGPDYADPLTYLSSLFMTTSNYNYYGYSNLEYDETVASTAPGGVYATDKDKRWEELIRAEAILLEEAGVFPIFQRGYALLVDTSVVGLEDNVVGTPFVYKNVEIK